MSWSAKFTEPHLVKGQKAKYQPLLLSQADKDLLDRAANTAGLSPSVMASRIVVQVLRTNRHRFEFGEFDQ